MQTRLHALFLVLCLFLSAAQGAHAAKEMGGECPTALAIEALLNVDPTGAAVRAYFKGLFQGRQEPSEEQWQALESLASRRLPDQAIIGFWQMLDNIPRSERKEKLMDQMPLVQVRNAAPETPRAKPASAAASGIGFHGRRTRKPLVVPRLPVSPPVQRNIERQSQRARARSQRFNHPRRSREGWLEQ